MRDFFTETGKLDNETIKELILARAKELKLKIIPDFTYDLIDQFWFRDFYNSFIADKFYFDLLLQHLIQEKFKEFSRFNYYSFLINKLLPVNKESWHKIAINFESWQTDRVKPADYLKLIKRLGLSPKTYGINFLIKNHLAKLDKVDEVEYLIWEHHTLTEFLAAEYLLIKENPIKEFEQLAVLKQEGVTAFKPSWTGVLRFLLESKAQKQTLDWLIGFLEKLPDNLTDELGEMICFVIKNADAKTKGRIFKLIYRHYFEQLTWIPVWVRDNLHKFINKDLYKQIKKDIKRWGDKTETYVRRGNVAAIVGGILENNQDFLTETEKEFWKNKFIKFIEKPDDDDNGVLRRHCLHALESYKDEKILHKLESFKLLDVQDSLVRDAFVELCYSLPNSKITINNLIEGLKKGSDIYARHGLYKITKPVSLKYFLKKIASDEQFLKAFLQHEEIFDKETGDWQIINRIKQLKGKNSLAILKRLFFNFMKLEHFHYVEKSNFVKQLGIIINNQDNKFLFGILDDIKNTEPDKIFHRFFDYEDFIALFLNQTNTKDYFKALDKLPDVVKSRAGFVAYAAKRVNGKTGEKVYQLAVKLGKIKPLDSQPKELPWEKQEQKKKQDRLDQFIKLLGKDEMFFTNLFQYYWQNKDELNEFFKTSKGKIAKQRLIHLAANGIEKIDPRKFKVTIPDKSTKKFNWPVPATYFGDLLDVVNQFKALLIKQYRQKIIDFIPYAFSDDMGRIMDLIDKISDKELDFVNEVMMNPKDDRRYLVPGTYIYLITHYTKKGSKLPSTRKVFESFFDDKDLPDYERRSSLENLEFIVEKPDAKLKHKLLKIFNETPDQNLKKTVNALLIALYKDEAAIDWRFNKLKQPFKFDRRKIEGFHSVGPEEHELDSLGFAKPLIELKDDKYLQKFLDLFRFSVDLSKEDKKNEFYSYIEYLWKIVIAYVEKLKELKSIEPVKELNKFLEKSKKQFGYEKINWFKSRLNQVRTEYINYLSISKPSTKFYTQNVSEINKQTSIKHDDKERSESTKLNEVASFLKNKKIKLYISHASGTSIYKELSIGEKKFVNSLVANLRKKYSNKNDIFFDKDNRLSTIDFDPYLSNYKLMLFIVSNRYLKRANVHSSWAQIEKNHFINRSQDHNVDFGVIVLYDIKRDKFKDQLASIGNKRNILVKLIEPQDVNFSDKVNKVVKKVLSEISYFEKKYNVTI